MRKSKIDAAVKALMCDPDGMSPDYIDRLLDGFERHRTNHARNLAAWIKEQDASDRTNFPPPFPEKLLHKFLEYTSHDIKDVLIDLMEGEDCKRAAVLFEYGHVHGFWQASEDMLAYARELSVDVVPEQDDTRFRELKTALLTSAIRKAASVKAERNKLSPGKYASAALRDALGANRHMRLILSDPKSSDAQRLISIKDFYAALLVAGHGAFLKEAF